MKGFVGGQHTRLESLTPTSVLLVGVQTEQETVFGFDCFTADENNKPSGDRYFVYYDQRRSPEGGIPALGPKAGNAGVKRPAVGFA
jgi:stress response protein SCP2